MPDGRAHSIPAITGALIVTRYERSDWCSPDLLAQDAPPTADSSSLDVYARIEPSQRELIRSLEWLTFDPATYSQALEQSNALVRYFLGP